MSLTQLLASPDVRETLKPLRPKVSRKLAVPLKIEPRSKRYTVVGTAFDYFLRFELNRRCPNAISRPWVAEQAAQIVPANATGSIAPDDFLISAGEILDEAKQIVGDYLTRPDPSKATKMKLAAYSIKLAKLDLVHRANLLEPTFDQAEPADVEDLVDLLTIVPFEKFLDEQPLLLNPTFGEASTAVGGADADIIAGNLLIDIKTSKKGQIQAPSLDQMLGYFFLARNHRARNSEFPRITKIGLYFSRHGYLQTFAASEWESQPQFLEIQNQFFEKATEMFG